MGWGRGQVPVWWTPRIRIQCESGASGRMPKQARAPRPPAFSVPRLGHSASRFLTATQSFNQVASSTSIAESLPPSECCSGLEDGLLCTYRREVCTEKIARIQPQCFH